MSRSYYIFNSGRLRRNDDTLQFVQANGEKRNIPVEDIFDMYIFGELDINSKAINFIATHNINVHFFNYYGFYTSSLIAKSKYISGKLLIQQVTHYTDNDKRIALVKEILKGAAANIYRNLRYYNSRGKDLARSMNDISHLQHNIDNYQTVSRLMGNEGAIRKVYYAQWQTILNDDIEFKKRVKRPPDNVVNTLISFVNSLVYTTVLSQIYHTHLNPTLSYLHEPGESRYSLSLDIAEIFKPLIADRLIFALLNKKQIQEKHFDEQLNYLHLTETGRKIILQEYDKTLNRTIYHKTLDKHVTYKYLIRLECYKLIKHLNGEKDYDSFKIWW